MDELRHFRHHCCGIWRPETGGTHEHKRNDGKPNQG